MIKPVSKPARSRRFLTYDLEWYPDTLRLRVLGLFDGETYCYFRRARDFLRHVLRPKFAGAWFYAHAGGLYDFQFLLEELVREGWEVEAAFSGSSAIIVQVKRGGLSWHFVDSLWLLRDSLANIGRMVGMEKGDCAFDAPLPELIAYNEQDCRILWHAIEFFESFVQSLGGELQKTIASTAMALFKRAYLSRALHVPKSVNDMAREAYTGSRVEPFWVGPVEDGVDYDINSSFPAAMRQPQPADFVGLAHGRIPKRGRWLAEVTLEVPEVYLPPLPYRRATGGVYFPTGKWRGVVNDVDFRLGEEQGVKFSRIGRVAVFSEFEDLRGYAEDIYEKRRKATSSAEKYVLKVLLNALYGKFSERDEKEKLVVNPSDEWLKKTARDDRRMVSPGVFLLAQRVPVPHEHVAISANITAIARRALFEFMADCRELYYCDTDGFCCNADQVFPTSDQLGALKLVQGFGPWHDARGKRQPGALFIAPKLYSMHDGEKLTIKAKGFSRIKAHSEGPRLPGEREETSRAMSYEEFAELLDHKEVALESFARLRSTMKTPELKPFSREIGKTWRGATQPKRARIGDQGATRPWRVEEIET